ncbi:ACP S-malonyltransferase [Aerococcaceae bacterium DSM 111176]|nr:ACP S-malonyltransferase [Aerococcaceae bacterium DSM 111176]
MTLAIIFNGQGAQYEGMGLDFNEQIPMAKSVFDTAEEVTDYSIREWIESDQEKFNQTQFSQPAIAAVSLAIFHSLKAEYPQISQAKYMAGLSLGEYSSLMASGMLSLEDGFTLLKERGRLMTEHCQVLEEKQPVQMAAVIAMPLDEIKALVEEIHSEETPLYIANLNSTSQIIIAGVKDSITTFRKRAKEAGYKKVMPLKVEGPFHSPLMQAVCEPFKEVLAHFKFNTGSVPVISNTTLEEHTPERVTDLLVRHLVEPVRFQETIEQFQNEGVTHLIQIGPGPTLANLLKREENVPKCLVVDKVADLALVPEFLNDLSN